MTKTKLMCFFIVKIPSFLSDFLLDDFIIARYAAFVKAALVTNRIHFILKKKPPHKVRRPKNHSG